MHLSLGNSRAAATAAGEAEAVLKRSDAVLPGVFL